MSKNEVTSRNIRVADLEKQKLYDRKFRELFENPQRTCYGIELDSLKKKREKEIEDNND